MGKKTITAVVVGLMFACLLLWSGEASAKSGKDVKDVVVEEVSKIRCDNPDFKIRLKPVSRSGKFCIGEEIEFKFRTNRDAYLSIIDIGTSGKVHVIFPNKWHRSNKVRRGRWYRIPSRDSDFVFRVKGPAGVNYVKAIGTLKPFDCFPKEALLQGKEAFLELKEPEKVIKDLGVELRKQDRKGWTEAETNFTVLGSRAECRGGREREEARERDRERFVVKLWTEKKVYPVGETVTFFFYPERDCYLNLIDFGTSGKVRVIFPNRGQRDNFVKGGKVLAIPASKKDEFRFRVKGPTGVEVVKAIATTNRCQLYRGSYDFDKYVYQPWDEKSEKIDKDIEVQLDEMPDDVYVKARTSFRVVP